MPFGLGPFELILILLIVMVIFGAGKLPQVFGSLGKGIKEFRTAAGEEPGAPGSTTTTVTSTQAPIAPNSTTPVAPPPATTDEVKRNG